MNLKPMRKTTFWQRSKLGRLSSQVPFLRMSARSNISALLYTFKYYLGPENGDVQKVSYGVVGLVPVTLEVSYEEPSAIFLASSTTVRMILFNSAFQPISRHFSHCPKSSFDSISSVS